MTPLIGLSVALPAGLLVWALMHICKIRTRRRLFNRPPPDHWLTVLQDKVPQAADLPDFLRKNLFGCMQLFLKEKHFEGCGGLQLTEEMRIVVTAQACMLLMGRPTLKVYPRLKSILIYPHTYTAGRQGLFGGRNGEGARLGESWNRGVVVLAWDSVLGGARNPDDGHNVAFHEFAHQLDQEDGSADGVPTLTDRPAYTVWARVCKRDFDRLVDRKRRGRKSVLDPYGAVNPAEFFAVATEAFFEKPEQLQRKHPELFDALKQFYRLDPAVPGRIPTGFAAQSA